MLCKCILSVELPSVLGKRTEMNREEILKKAQEDKGNNEWEQSIADRGIILGYAVTIILALIVLGIQLVLKSPHWEVVGVPMVGIGVGDLYEGFKTEINKKKRSGACNLVIGIMFMIAAIIRW